MREFNKRLFEITEFMCPYLLIIMQSFQSTSHYVEEWVFTLSVLVVGPGCSLSHGSCGDGGRVLLLNGGHLRWHAGLGHGSHLARHHLRDHLVGAHLGPHVGGAAAGHGRAAGPEALVTHLTLVHHLATRVACKKTHKRKLNASHIDTKMVQIAASV